LNRYAKTNRMLLLKIFQTLNELEIGALKIVRYEYGKLINYYSYIILISYFIGPLPPPSASKHLSTISFLEFGYNNCET